MLCRRRSGRAVHADVRVKALVPGVGEPWTTARFRLTLERCGSSCKRSRRLASPGSRCAARSSSAPARRPIMSLLAERSRACRADTRPSRLGRWSSSGRRNNGARRGRARFSTQSWDAGGASPMSSDDQRWSAASSADGAGVAASSRPRRRSGLIDGQSDAPAGEQARTDIGARYPNLPGSISDLTRAVCVVRHEPVRGGGDAAARCRAHTVMAHR